jgi:hypothetical protein
MAYDGDGRGGLLSAGGILSIIVGAFEIILGGLIAALMSLSLPFLGYLFPLVPGFEGGYSMAAVPIWSIIVGIVIAVLGIVAVVGGVSAIRRGSFGLSLAGAICALLLINPLGLLAVIFVSLGKREFGAIEDYEVGS